MKESMETTDRTAEEQIEANTYCVIDMHGESHDVLYPDDVKKILVHLQEQNRQQKETIERLEQSTHNDWRLHIQRITEKESTINNLVEALEKAKVTFKELEKMYSPQITRSISKAGIEAIDEAISQAKSLTPSDSDSFKLAYERECAKVDQLNERIAYLEEQLKSR